MWQQLIRYGDGYHGQVERPVLGRPSLWWDRGRIFESRSLPGRPASSAASVFFSLDRTSWHEFQWCLLFNALLSGKCNPAPTWLIPSCPHLRYSFCLFWELQCGIIFLPPKNSEITAPFNHQSIVFVPMSYMYYKHMVHNAIFRFAFRMSPRSQTPTRCTANAWAFSYKKLPISQTQANTLQELCRGWIIFYTQYPCATR